MDIGVCEESWGVVDKEMDERKELFPNLLKLSDAETERFKQVMKLYSGKLRILVHPFFTPDHLYMDKALSSYYEALERLLRSDSVKRLPLLVLDEGGEDYVEKQVELQKMLPKSDSGNIWYIPTCVNDPLPIMDYQGFPEAKRVTDWEEVELWRKVGKKLTTYGVKKIVVSGQCLDLCQHRTKWDPGDLGKQYEDRNPWLAENSITGCAGAVATFLAKDIKIDVSNLAYPDNWTAILRANKRKVL